MRKMKLFGRRIEIGKIAPGSKEQPQWLAAGRKQGLQGVQHVQYTALSRSSILHSIVSQLHNIKLNNPEDAV